MFSTEIGMFSTEIYNRKKEAHKHTKKLLLVGDSIATTITGTNITYSIRHYIFNTLS
jgi:hypothetical protein